MIHALHWLPETGVNEIRDPSLFQGVRDEGRGLLWVDFDRPTEEETRVLLDVFRFHSLTVEDCLRDVHHPKIDDFDEYLFIVIHGVRPVDIREEPVVTEELDVYLGRNLLVTFHMEPRRSISSIREKCRQKPNTMSKGPDYLLYEICDVLVDNYAPLMETLDTLVSDIEKNVIDDVKPEVLSETLALRKDITYVRRILQPQREILNRLARGEFDQISENVRVFFRDISDHLYRVADQTESLRERMTGALEAYLSMTNLRLQEVMKILTVFATIAIPLTVLTSFWGMNFASLPWIHTEHGWWWSVGLMSGVTLLLLIFFRSRRWL